MPRLRKERYEAIDTEIETMSRSGATARAMHRSLAARGTRISYDLVLERINRLKDRIAATAPTQQQAAVMPGPTQPQGKMEREGDDKRIADLERRVAALEQALIRMASGRG